MERDGKMQQLTIKNSNRILCATTAVMVAVQFILVMIGFNDTVMLLLATQICILLISILGLWLSNVDMKEVLRMHPIRLKTALFAFLAVLCAFPIISLLNVLSMFFVKNAVIDVAGDVYQYGLGISLFVMALMPAVGEEVLVRGVIYHSYREKSPILAWLLSAVIFGMMHMNFNQMPYAIFLGLLMVVMVEASDSIVTSMCMHFFVNGISTLSGYFSQTELGEMAEAELAVESMLGTGEMMKITLISMGILALIMVPLIICVIVATFRINGRSFSQAFEKTENVYHMNALPEVREKDKIIDIWLILAVLIMVILTILNTVG